MRLAEGHFRVNTKITAERVSKIALKGINLGGKSNISRKLENQAANLQLLRSQIFMLKSSAINIVISIRAAMMAHHMEKMYLDNSKPIKATLMVITIIKHNNKSVQDIFLKQIQ